MIKPILGAFALVTAGALPLLADDVTDTLASALKAYEDGDVAYALEELDYARQLLIEMKTQALGAFLPDPPEGWTREVNNDMNAGLAMMGGGAGAEAEYSNGDTTITITLMADNPLVGAMGGMIANAGLMGAKVERIGRQKFMIQDDEITGLVDNRILVKSEGGEVEQALELLGQIDFRELADFGR